MQIFIGMQPWRLNPGGQCPSRACLSFDAKLHRTKVKLNAYDREGITLKVNALHFLKQKAIRLTQSTFLSFRLSTTHDRP